MQVQQVILLNQNHILRLITSIPQQFTQRGAEVIRMVATLLGEEGFRKGMDKYFELFDGQAVTTEDFLKSMSLANGDYDFSQFKNWYDQAGTPEIKVSWVHREGGFISYGSANLSRDSWATDKRAFSFSSQNFCIRP